MSWSHAVRLGEIPRSGLSLRLEPDAGERAAIAARLNLVGLPRLTAELTLRPWLDGAELTGAFEAVVTQTCGVSLEAFDEEVSGEIEVRLLPAGSPHAQATPAQAEVELDPDAPDPPDLLEGDSLDPAAYVAEYLALAIDPFPRKPGATFDYADEPREESPFAILKRLKSDEG